LKAALFAPLVQTVRPVRSPDWRTCRHLHGHGHLHTAKIGRWDGIQRTTRHLPVMPVVTALSSWGRRPHFGAAERDLHRLPTIIYLLFASILLRLAFGKLLRLVLICVPSDRGWGKLTLRTSFWRWPCSTRSSGAPVDGVLGQPFFGVQPLTFLPPPIPLPTKYAAPEPAAEDPQPQPRN
jgi:hypothetical protein